MTPEEFLASMDVKLTDRQAQAIKEQLTNDPRVTCGYPLYLDGIVDITPYPFGQYPQLGDVVVVSEGEQVGSVGQVVSINSTMRAKFVTLRRMWPRNRNWAPEVRFNAVAQVVPAIPKFDSQAEADLWMERAVPLAEGQKVRFQLPITQALYDFPPGDITYEGVLVGIRDLDIEYWWRHRPMAEGSFEVVWVDSDSQPHLLNVGRVVRA